MPLVTIENIDNFKEVLDFPASQIIPEVIEHVQKLDEREELEPFIRSILADSSDTPHGPVEIVDILTHKVSVRGEPGMAAFILKGKSFSKVRPENVAHQIYRLEKIADLKFAVFAATGTILDQAKEQFISTANRLGYHYAVLDAVDLARLFVAYGFICPRDARRIAAGRCRCGYSPTKRLLNVLQVESLKALELAHKINQQSGLVVLPTGSGKTRIAVEDSNQISAERILYVAHTQEILDVAQSEFEAVFGKESVTRHSVRASLRRPNRVNLVTIQLLGRNLSSVSTDIFDYIIIDEFHHVAAKSYRRLIEKTNPKFLLGLTATPFRGDRQDILELCGQNVLVNFELRSGIEMGILSPYHYFGCFDDIDYSDIRHNGLRYDIRDLEKALIIPERDAAIIEKWKTLADDKPTIAFCCSHRHAYRVAESFRDSGIPAEIYLSDTRSDERKRLVDRLLSGRMKVICSVDIMNEGVDIPFIECLLFLRPTESQRIFYQQLGRGLRRYIGKSHCIVIDFIGNFKNAYKLVEYQGLLPSEVDVSAAFTKIRSIKEAFNLPFGCEVRFDDKVIDIFVRQTMDPRKATRHNIGKILIYQYLKLEKMLRRKPSRADVDRCLLLNSELYGLVFGGWTNFMEIVNADQ